MSRLKIKPSKLEKRLDEIYSQLPKIECRQLCQEACGPIGMTQLEAHRIKKVTHELPVYTQAAGHCSMLTEAGQCHCYRVRPLICRLFALTPKMACPFGCVPEYWLSDGDVLAFMDEVEQLTGQSTDSYMSVTNEELLLIEEHMKRLAEERKCRNNY